MIQVRNVPEELHRELQRRAEERGLTLTAYIQGVLEREVATPPLTELAERIRSREPVDLDRETIVRMIREGRGELP